MDPRLYRLHYHTTHIIIIRYILQSNWLRTAHASRHKRVNDNAHHRFKWFRIKNNDFVKKSIILFPVMMDKTKKISSSTGPIGLTLCCPPYDDVVRNSAAAQECQCDGTHPVQYYIIITTDDRMYTPVDGRPPPQII